MIGKMEMQLVDRQNLVIAKLAGKLGRAEVELDQAKKSLVQLRKTNDIHNNALDELRIVALDALSPIEEAINALGRHDIEIPGLRAAHADLRSAAE